MDIFDIFSGTVEIEALWQCCVEGYPEAVFIMEKLAAEKPGAYFVYDARTGKVLVRVNTTPVGPRRTGTPARKGKAA